MQEFAIRPGFAWELCAALGVPGAEFYGISHLSCVSVLRAVEVARRFHARAGAHREDRVLVLGGDQGSYDDSARIIPMVTVAGDAAAAVVVQSAHGSQLPRYRYLAGAALHDHRFHRVLRMTQAELTLYQKACLEHVATVLGKAAGRAGLSITDIDWIMPDLSSTMFWRKLCASTCCRCAGITTGSTRCWRSSTPTRTGSCGPATGARWSRSGQGHTSR
jgi:3-oxoacyl-[acyl-carrier-protein] synthase-3